MTAPELVQELEVIESLFVQTAMNAEHAGERIVLKDVSPATLYFSDRPLRVTGHIGTPSSSASGAKATTALPTTRRMPSCHFLVRVKWCSPMRQRVVYLNLGGSHDPHVRRIWRGDLV